MKRRGIAAPASWLLATVLSAPTAHAQAVKDYRVFFATCRAPQCGPSLVVLRSFHQGSVGFVLAVDSETLETQILPDKGLELHQLSWAKLKEMTTLTPFGRAMADAEKTAAAEQDAGIVHSLPPGNGVVLTVDLCPSIHPLDRALFTKILDNFAPEEKPVPLGVAITGRWMLEHPKDLVWLRQLERDREFAVTWINHSFNHRYSPQLPLSRNFLLEAGTDANFEVLGTEAAMIDNDLCPSIFFRFPGLVSDPALVRRVIAYGLVPVGSDAWLAKSQAPKPGSIVLVHGNGNEPLGIEKFLALMKQEQTAIRQKNWLLYDLRESVSEQEEIQ
jgi:hypothetical protein